MLGVTIIPTAPDHGFVDITKSNVTFDCADQPPGWQPGTGSLTFTGDSDGSAKARARALTGAACIFPC